MDFSKKNLLLLGSCILSSWLQLAPTIACLGQENDGINAHFRIAEGSDRTAFYSFSSFPSREILALVRAEPSADPKLFVYKLGRTEIKRLGNAKNTSEWSTIYPPSPSALGQPAQCRKDNRGHILLLAEAIDIMGQPSWQNQRLYYWSDDKLNQGKWAIASLDSNGKGHISIGDTNSIKQTSKFTTPTMSDAEMESTFETIVETVFQAPTISNISVGDRAIALVGTNQTFLKLKGPWVQLIDLLNGTKQNSHLIEISRSQFEAGRDRAGELFELETNESFPSEEKLAFSLANSAAKNDRRYPRQDPLIWILKQ